VEGEFSGAGLKNPLARAVDRGAWHLIPTG
jgi:hypothetical protein